MKARTLLATTAALLAGVSGAHAQVTVTGGAALFTLPPMTSFAYTTVTPAHGLAVPLSAPAYGITPVYGFTVEIPVGGRFAIVGSGFYAGATSTFTDSDLLSGGGGFGLFPPYPGAGFVNAYAMYTDEFDAPAYASVGLGSGFDLDGFAFGIAMADEDMSFDQCHNPGIGCSLNVDATGVNPGTAFAYGTTLSEEGIFIVAAGIAPDGAIAITETSGFRYLGGQAGLSARLDVAGGWRATAQAGGIFRSLEQVHSTRLDVAFELPVGIDTPTVEQTATTEENLLTRYYGAFFALSTSRDVGRFLTAGVDVSVAPLLARTTYAANQSTSLSVSGPGTSIDWDLTMPTVTDTLTRGAVLLNLGGNLGFRFGGAASLTFGGFLEFLSAAPYVQQNYVPGNAVQSVPVGGYVNAFGATAYLGNANPNNLGSQAVAVFFNPMMTYGASVTLTIGLGGR